MQILCQAQSEKQGKRMNWKRDAKKIYPFASIKLLCEHCENILQVRIDFGVDFPQVVTCPFCQRELILSFKQVGIIINQYAQFGD